MTIPERRRRIKEIRQRVTEYHGHKNDPYAYFPEEIPEVGNLINNALTDIEFLLKEVGHGQKRLRPKRSSCTGHS